MCGCRFDHGMKHSWQVNVDSEDRLAPHDPCAVHAGLRRADDVEILRVLERQRIEVGRGYARRGIGQFAVTPASSGFAVDDKALVRGKLACRNAGSPRSRLDQHCPRRCARPAHRDVGEPHREAAACALAFETRGVEVGLHDRDFVPRAVEFLGDQHRQCGHYALADLGVLGSDGDRAVGGNGDELCELDSGLVRIAKCGSRQGQAQRKAPACQRRDLEECTAVECGG